MYRKDRYTIVCRNCSKEHKVGDNRIRYCSIGCYNTHTKTKGIDGYKECEICKKQIPFRKSLKVRGYKNIASIKTRFCSRKCIMHWRNQIDNPSKRPEVREKNSIQRRGIVPTHLHTPECLQKRRKTISGSNHWNWQGGITSENKRRRNSFETKQWRKAVFERDDYTCQICKVKGGYLQADHIKPWSTHKELRTELSNGRTLCAGCHRKTDTYGIKAKKKK